MNLIHAATYEQIKTTTQNGWDNVWSIPVDPAKIAFVEISGCATNATGANGSEAFCWGQTGLFVPNGGTLAAVLAGDGMRNVFADIKTAGANWNVRVQIIDNHLNVDINGANGMTVNWIVRLELVQWPA
jgi:hypothetical protein